MNKLEDSKTFSLMFKKHLTKKMKHLEVSKKLHPKKSKKFQNCICHNGNSIMCRPPILRRKRKQRQLDEPRTFKGNHNKIPNSKNINESLHVSRSTRCFRNMQEQSTPPKKSILKLQSLTVFSYHIITILTTKLELN